MNVTRRTFLTTSAVAAVGVMVPTPAPVMNPFNRYVMANRGRVVMMSNPVGPDWAMKYAYYAGRQWLFFHENDQQWHPHRSLR